MRSINISSGVFMQPSATLRVFNGP